MNRQASITHFVSGSFQVENISLSYICDNQKRIVQLTFAMDHHNKAKEDIFSSVQETVFYPDTEFTKTVTGVILRYLSGQEKAIPLSTSQFLVKRGTDLQRKTWELISDIPYGYTRTYGDLARELGNVRLARAVGQACHLNPLALIVPCHRVVAADGIGGFAAEGDVKARLLAMEKENC